LVGEKVERRLVYSGLNILATLLHIFPHVKRQAKNRGRYQTNENNRLVVFLGGSGRLEQFSAPSLFRANWPTTDHKAEHIGNNVSPELQ